MPQKSVREACKRGESRGCLAQPSRGRLILRSLDALGPGARGSLLGGARGQAGRRLHSAASRRHPAAAADACKKLQELFGAGFKREQSVAALILARGNLEQAADMCLAAAEH